MEYIGSITIYLTAFAISIISFAFAEQGYKHGKNNKGAVIIGLLVGIMVPCLLAGFRADTVGVDVKGYVEPFFERAHACKSFAEFRTWIINSNYSSELFYSFLVFFFSRIADDCWIVLFCMQLLTITPIVRAAIEMRSRVSISLVMIVYLFCFYNISFNVIRQSVACSFILLGTVYYWKSDCKINKKTVVNWIISVFMHSTAILGIMMSYLLLRIPKRKIKRSVRLLIYFLIIASPVFAYGATTFLLKLGVFPNKLQYYANIFIFKTIQKDWYNNPFSLYCILYILFAFVLFAVPTIFICFINKKHKKDRFSEDLINLTSVGFLINAVILYSLSTTYGSRISMFLDYFVILLIPSCAQASGKKEKYLIMVAMVLTYWLVWIIRMGCSGSSFYEFRF